MFAGGAHGLVRARFVGLDSLARLSDRATGTLFPDLGLLRATCPQTQAEWITGR